VAGLTIDFSRGERKSVVRVTDMGKLVPLLSWKRGW